MMIMKQIRDASQLKAQLTRLPSFVRNFLTKLTASKANSATRSAARGAGTLLGAPPTTMYASNTRGTNDQQVRQVATNAI